MVRHGVCVNFCAVKLTVPKTDCSMVKRECLPVKLWSLIRDFQQSQ
jgi:hypothetical protein